MSAIPQRPAALQGLGGGAFGPPLLVARKEIRALWRDGRFAAFAVLLCLLALAAGAASVHEHAALERERAQASASMRKQWEGQGNKHPHSAAHFGTYVFKPESAVAALDPGLRPFIGRTIWLEPHKRNPAKYLPAQDGGLSGRFPPLTVASLLYWLLPLLAIGAAFGSVAHEREAGTLKLLLASGASPAGLLLGKFAGLAGAILPVYVALMAVVAALLASSLQLSADDWPRLAGFALAHGALLLVALALSVAASAWFAQARTALLALLVFWTLNVFAVPRLVTAAAEHAYPLPSAEAFWRGITHDIEHGLPGDGSAKERLKKLEAKVLAQYKVGKLDELPVGFGGLRLRAGDAYSEKIHDLHFGRLWASFESQSRVHLAAALAGPFAPVRALSQGFAGTDLAHQQAFETAAEAYRRYFVNYTSDKVAELGTGTDWNVKGSEALWKEIGDFGYRAPALTGDLSPRMWTIALLVLWCLLGGLALWGAARELRLRG